MKKIKIKISYNEYYHFPDLKWNSNPRKKAFGLRSHSPVIPPSPNLTVSMMLKEEPENPKCFAEGRKDFTCFWEEDEERAGSVDQYSFTYTYQ